MTFRFATPADLARMSWYQREKYHARRRAYARSLEAERPKVRPANALPPSLSVKMSGILDELTILAEEFDAQAKVKQGVKPCGTTAAFRRHQRNGEIPCPECVAAERLRSAQRRDKARPNRQRRRSGTHADPYGRQHTA